MKTLLVDNYDSYTFNLFQLLAEVNAEEPVVVRNDEVDWAGICALRPDNIVISPGPGHPGRPADFGVCADVLRYADVPVLGVCLGHQGIGVAAGASVRRAPSPEHGRLSRVWHDDSPLFHGIPQGFTVVRYHSLAVHELPADLAATAWTADGVLMGLAHRSRPQWGVQFHPESVATQFGHRLLANFRDLTPVEPVRRTRRRTPAAPVTAQRAAAAERNARAGTGAARESAPPRQEAPLQCTVRTLANWCEPEDAFASLYAPEEVSFWLDSSRTAPGMARFSFMGAADGPLSKVVRYDVAAQEITIESATGRQVHHGVLYDHLRQALAQGVAEAEAVPFDFTGGFVGYLGYELKADSGASQAHGSPHPDASLVFADRFLAFDHQERRVHLVALTRPGDAAAAEAWFGDLAHRLPRVPRLERPTGLDSEVTLARPTASRDEYVDAVRICQEYLAAGESYEICLTDRVRSDPLQADPFEVYRTLRRINPAPYSAYLRFGDLSVLCSSPERFLKIDRAGWAESKPIKGTARRSTDRAEDARLAARLTTDDKTRAENLMIVDLLRNDLGAVCEVGSVSVPHLMAVESYETVHQLVSTVRGRLRAGTSTVDCLHATFPGGSMTGAPKLRTMEIIDRLESSARGVYSGSIGFLGLNGTADLNIVIRTIVADSAGTVIGTGGAIVTHSDPQAEYDEILLKAEALARAVALAESPWAAADAPAARLTATLAAAGGDRRAHGATSGRN
ncbi:aminodeoxychorismate synthase [Streptomyces sp. NPDC051940]|uniref:aminodeoxychorismate synthase n=1 Tax=Streptomyces sp. NPDC051940 TaxID=3155675 RepID=UPI00342D2282